jgi:TPR repeat protein
MAHLKAMLSGLALVLSATSFAPARAGPLEDGYAAFQKGDYATALRLWTQLANEGNAEAQHNLGSMYYGGNKYEDAANWYQRAADRGIARSQRNLGGMYANGQGVSRNYVLAYKWTALAAEKGDEQAKSNLAAIAKLMTPEQVAEAQGLVRGWKPVASRKR